VDSTTGPTTGDVYAVGVPIILAMILFEVTYAALRQRRYYQLADVGGTVGLLAGNIIIAGTTQGLALALYFFLYQFRMINVATLVPLWAQWILAFVMIDLVYYWYHRCSHQVRFLWAVHMSHHCSQHMNFTVAFRQAWLGSVSKIPFYTSLPLIGLDPSITAVAGVIATLWGVIGHTQIIPRLDPLTEFVFNTPSSHRVHHGTNPEYLDRNYGNLFMIWDRMFGTYAKENAPITYGLINNLETNNPVSITMHVWRDIARDIRTSTTVREKLRAVFGPPGGLRLNVGDTTNESTG